MEQELDKDEILEGYLNTINYGGVFGIESASKYYFNKSANELTLAECAFLAGINHMPNYYNPFKLSSDHIATWSNGPINISYILKASAP